MTQKIVTLFIFSCILLSCDGDFKQGKCDEGYFEQDNFEGGSYCVPLSDKDETEDTITDAKILNTIN